MSTKVCFFKNVLDKRGLIQKFAKTAPANKQGIFFKFLFLADICFHLHTVVDRKDWTLHRAIEVKLP